MRGMGMKSGGGLRRGGGRERFDSAGRGRFESLVWTAGEATFCWEDEGMERLEERWGVLYP